jgi:hypothetical protein
VRKVLASDALVWYFREKKKERRKKRKPDKTLGAAVGIQHSEFRITS